MPTKDGKVRILSIDGGGARGLLALQVLERMEELAVRGAGQLFDYITGTSTGGMIALALAKRQPFAAKAISDIYRQYLPAIFERSAWYKLKTLGQLAGPKYNHTALETTARAILGGTGALSDATCNAMVPTYSITRRKPVFLSSYSTPSVRLYDAALATSAAPTYFAPWKVRDEYYVDGGTCDNNPALSAVIECCKLYDCTVRDCLVLSLGTGSEQRIIDGAQAQGWGALSWVDPLVSIFTDGVSELHGYHLNRLLPDANVLRIQCDVKGDMAEMDNVSEANLQALVKAGVNMANAYAPQIDNILTRLEA